MADQYVATLRAFFKADDEVEAIFIADQIKVNGEKDLEEEEGDELTVTQVTRIGVGYTPEEICNVVKHCRNVLIRTRVKRCFETARELDQLAWALEHGDTEMFGMAGYDYAKFMDVAEEILVRKGNPL